MRAGHKQQEQDENLPEAILRIPFQRQAEGIPEGFMGATPSHFRSKSQSNEVPWIILPYTFQVWIVVQKAKVWTERRWKRRTDLADAERIETIKIWRVWRGWTCPTQVLKSSACWLLARPRQLFGTVQWVSLRWPEVALARPDMTWHDLTWPDMAWQWEEGTNYNFLSLTVWHDRFSLISRSACNLSQDHLRVQWIANLEPQVFHSLIHMHPFLR